MRRREWPADNEKLKAELKANGLVVNYKNVVIHRDTPDTLNLVIRERELVQATETDVGKHGCAYPIPGDVYNFYAELFANGDPDLTDQALKRRLFDLRIGDYCVSLCA